MNVSISVVMPLFNKAPFVEEAVQGIARQLGDDDELIVVDDRSSDDGPARVAALGLERVRLVRCAANEGPATARNIGAREARGDYLLFFDADDVPEPNVLQVLRDCIRRFPDAVVFAYELAFEARGESIADGLAADDGLYGQVVARDGFALSCLRGKPLCTASSTCVRADAFKASGGFRAGLRYCEDPELWARLSASYPIVHIDRVLARYRDVARSLSHQLRSTPGAVQPYVTTLLALSREPDDAYHRLARNLIAKNVAFSASTSGNRAAVAHYLRTTKRTLGPLRYATLRLLACLPSAWLRWPFDLRSRLALRRLRQAGSLI